MGKSIASGGTLHQHLRLQQDGRSVLYLVARQGVVATPVELVGQQGIRVRGGSWVLSGQSPNVSRTN